MHVANIRKTLDVKGERKVENPKFISYINDQEVEGG